MDRSVAARAVVLAALLLTAGCAAPVADDAVATAPEVTYAGGSLPFAAGPVFEDVRRTLGANVSAPAHVRVVSDPSALAGTDAPAMPRFWRIAGLETESGLSPDATARLENGVTTATGDVAIYPGERPDDGDRRVLAHEFVHYVQFRERAVGAIARSVPTDTTDGQFVLRAVVEGAAVVATDAYLRRTAPDGPSNTALYRSLAERLAPGSYARYVNWAYLEGRAYVDGRVADPAEMGPVYTRPPTTSEQVLHGYAPGAEPAAPLSVRPRAGTAFRPAASDRLGEAFLRSALAGSLDVERAARAAAGWGADELVTFRRADARNASYAWVLRWDSPGDADEFARAMRDALAARGAETDAGWRVEGANATLRRPAPDTTVLLAGDRAFVTGTTVTVGDGVVLGPP